MRIRCTPAILAVVSMSLGCTTVQAVDDYRTIFNGKDLTNWEGLAETWSVKDGAITGQTSADKPLKHNTFLVWKGGEVGDFELKLKYRIVGGNSGIQYRSKLLDPEKFIVGGYQADFEAGPKYSGILYEERGTRGIIAERGQKVTVNPDGTKQVEQFAQSAAIQNFIKSEDWNEYTIIARGNHLVHMINGIKTVEVIDNQADKAATSGILALQVHVGPPMTVQFKDIRIKDLSTGKAQARGRGRRAASQATSGPGGAATPVDQLKLLPGFRAELVYEVPKREHGSWVNLCVDPKGRLIASDQGGKLYRITPAGVQKATETTVEPIEVRARPDGAPLGASHGLLWAFDSLYVMVTDSKTEPHGLYRVRDTDGDDQLDTAELLRKLEGGGEHGPHAIVPGPDGKSLYIVAGNHTKMTNFDRSRVPTNWDEDQLLPRMWDAGGHAVGVLAPGGWICKTDPDGKSWEVVCIGFRNEFDAAFNEDGELFTFDADMEWDIGAPWYRPTRVCHVVSGGEFGWRSGTGKWPVYYPDSLPPVVDIGPGSPTGIAFAYEAEFPRAYQEALYICDWSFGKMYAVHLKPEGGSFKGEAELFVSGSPLPLTDVVVNPKDGAMYFTIGGRGTQSALYRVTHDGSRTARKPVKDERKDKKLRELRHKLEAFHGKQDPRAIDAAWKYLGHEDRFIRYAARLAIEHQPVAQWRDRALAEEEPQALLTALLALARQGESSSCGELMQALDRLDYGQLPQALRLEALRVLGVAMIRMGRPDQGTIDAIVARLDPHYPATTVEENYELSRMLAYLEAPSVVSKTMNLLARAPTQEEQVHYALVLRGVKAGWTPDSRREYFQWFGRARTFRGGHSFGKFLVNIRNEALAALSEPEKAALGDVLAQASEASPSLAEAPQRPFVKEWTTDEVAALSGRLKGRNYEHGRKLFAAVQCASCHRFNNEGGSVGPDLTAVAGRFSVRDLAEAIVEPNKVVSDQYRNTVFVLSDGRQVVGRVANLAGDNLMVVTNQLAPGDFTNVNRSQILAQLESPVSPMMAGLLNTLSEPEVLDLLAYLVSGGDRNHKVFR